MSLLGWHYSDTHTRQWTEGNKISDNSPHEYRCKNVKRIVLISLICHNIFLIAQYFYFNLCNIVYLLLSIISVIALFQIFNTHYLDYCSNFPICVCTSSPLFSLCSTRVFFLNPPSHHVTPGFEWKTFNSSIGLFNPMINSYFSI